MANEPPIPGLRPEPLTAQRFAHYGDVVSAGDGPGSLVNDGRATRFNGLAALSHTTGAPHPALAVYVVRPSGMPFMVSVFERHPRSSQIFVPMADADFLVIVAPDRGGRPDVGRAEAFRPGPQTGIHYRPGIWHVPLAVFGREAAFAMLMWETGVQDTVEYRLNRPLVVHPSS
jgi:ureidoglycolate lyase